MMTKQEITADLQKTMGIYLEALSNYDINKFNDKPQEEIWSLSQMYEHLVTSSNFYFLANAQRCIEKRKGQEGGEKNQYGENIFKYNSFPPVKIKMPGNGPQPNHASKSLEDYKVELTKVMSDTTALMERLESDNDYKTASANLGFFNAQEWLQLQVMHLRHHLTQKTELEA